MKNKKRFLSIGVLIAVVCTAMGNPFPKTTEAAMPQYEEVYFKETFDTDGTLDGWTASANACKTMVSGGVFARPYNDDQERFMYVNTEEVIVSDYTLSCNVTFEEVQDVAKASTVSAGIVARVDSSSYKTTGYEFQMSVTGNTVKGILRDRNNSSLNQQNTVTLEKDIYNTPHQLKIEVYGTSIKCYIDGILTNEVTDDAYASGTAEIRLKGSNLGVNVICDNFKVYDEKVRDYKFCDDFSGYTAETNLQNRNIFESNGWYVGSNANAGLAKSGAYVIPSDNATQHVFIQTQNGKGALGWNDYSIEADVTIGTSTTDTLSTDVMACITGRHVDTSGNGYEVQLYVPQSGTSMLRINARGAGGVLEDVEFPIEFGTTYNLKAIFQDDTIYAYVDDELVITATSTAYPIGYAGIRRTTGAGNTACGVDIKFDNFVVYDYNEGLPMYLEHFNDYQSIVGNAESIKGLMKSHGWNPNNARAGYFLGTTYASAYDNKTNLVLSNLSEAAEWTDYSVEATLTFDSQNTSGSGDTIVGVAGRFNGDQIANGYSLLIKRSYDGTSVLRLRGGSSYLVTVDINSVPLDTPITLKMSFVGNTIIGYCNGVEEIKYESATAFTKGYAGIIDFSDVGYTVVFDDFKVCDLVNPYVKEIVGDIDTNKIVNDLDTATLRSQLLEDTQSTACDVNKSSEIDICDLAREKKLVYSLQN